MTRVIVAFLVLCAVFGTTFGAIEVGLRGGWPPLLSAGLRFACAGIVVLAVAALRGGWRKLDRRACAEIAFVGSTVTAATFGVLYSAERVVPSGIAAVLCATAPMFAVAIAALAKQRRVDIAVLAGLALGFAGTALVAGRGSVELASPAARYGAVAIVLVEIAYTGGLFVSRRLTARLPSLFVSGAQMTFGGTVLLVLSAVFEHPAHLRVDTAGVVSLVYLSLVASALAHSLSIWLADASSATFATSWTYVSPFIALVAGASLLAEPIGLAAWVGGALVVVACLLLNRDLVAVVRRRALPLRGH